MQIWGLTGGIASGKSTAATYVRDCLAITVIDADAIARDLTNKEATVISQIVATFGPDVLAADGSLDRQGLARLIFADPVKRRQLNAIVHPRVRLQILKQLLYYWTMGYQQVVLEVPLLFESGIHKWTSPNILIDCREDLQVARMHDRGGMEEADARQRMAAQMPRSQKKRLADIVIRNESDVASLQRQLQDVFAEHWPSFWKHRLLYHLVPLILFPCLLSLMLRQ